MLADILQLTAATNSKFPAVEHELYFLPLQGRLRSVVDAFVQESSHRVLTILGCDFSLSCPGHRYSADRWVKGGL